MKIDFRHLAKSWLQNLTPYQPGKPVEALARELGVHSAIKLASNENALGPSMRAMLAAEAALQQAHIYPDGGGFELKQALAAHFSVDAAQITLGNGSENILELIIKAYLHQDEVAVLSEYAFLTIPLLIRSYGAQMRVVPALNWGHDIAAMIEAIDEKTRMLFLVNPNNPTGTHTPLTEFTMLMEAVPPNVLIIVDEAYAEYIEDPNYPNGIRFLARYPNLIVTRTFSKVYGLAALRIGYAISSCEIADMLNRARLPFNVNSIAAKAACAALGDQAHVAQSVAFNHAGKLQLEEGLKKLELDYIPSIANFITVKVVDAERIYQSLLQEGVIVRPLSAYQMPKHIRVTVGTHDEIARFLTACKKCLHQLEIA